MSRTPLAWCNLTHDWVRFSLFVLGITFAVVLMFVQLGFRSALLDSNTQFHERINADLVMVSPARQALAMREFFPRRRLAQAEAVAGVASVHPVYFENGFGLMRDTRENVSEREPTRGIRVIGIDPDAYLLKLPELDPNNPNNRIETLKRPNSAWYDRKIPKIEGSITSYGPLEVGTETELTGRRIQFVGDFALGTDFTADGNLIVNDYTFIDILRRPFTLGASGADVDLGFVRLVPGADLKDVQKRLRANLATGEDEPDVEVFTIEELIDREQSFWLRSTPIGFAFTFGLVMGFVVGLVICYQILSGDVSDHMSEYATLKAIGYGNGYLTWVVVQEALILAVFGYIFGAIISWGIYELLAQTSGLPLQFSFTRLAWILLATIVMCVLSGLIALVGLLRADPADVF